MRRGKSYSWRPGPWLFGVHWGLWSWRPHLSLYPGYGWSVFWFIFEISRVA